MDKLQTFIHTLSDEAPAPSISVHLQALWYDGKGNWNKAHSLIDHLDDQQSAHVHAYLHRREGDIWNADYWYRRAAQVRPPYSLSQEWQELVLLFLNEG